MYITGVSIKDGVPLSVRMNVPSENYPFCTIDPNVAIVQVPDQRFKWLCEKYKPASEVTRHSTGLCA